MAGCRIVLLGASNLTRGISTVVETAGAVVGRPLDVLAALGHGRSYGMPSRVLGRTLPGIVQCGIWKSLADRPRMPTAALVTDIGNDLLYGAPVDEIIEWVIYCVDRLKCADARIIVTRLPINTISRLSDARFRLLRSVLFPRSRLTLAGAAAQATVLDERLNRLCIDRGLTQIAPAARWFGFDPIHIKMRHWPQAWQTMLTPWSSSTLSIPLAAGSLRRWFYLRRLAPERRWLLGFEQCRPQPAGRLDDGTEISYF
jgi:hypothetical protein